MLTAQNSALESWIYQVGLSHSGSKSTEKRYRLNMERFCRSIGKTADAVIEDYEKMPEKTFKRFYAQAIVAHLSELSADNQSSGSVSNALNTVKSFFKYNSLPLNYVPTVRVDIENHNRDIEAKEIVDILRDAEPRERAFYSLIAQAGLRPDTLTKLKIRNIEKILESETPIPCLITVEKNITKGGYQEYFTFASIESVTYLKEYFRTRQQPLTQDSYVFAMYDDESKPVRPGVFSHLFRRIVLKLRGQNILKFTDTRKKLKVKDKDHKVIRNIVTRNELRLYNLRKFFRKYAGQAGPDYVNFWMGHTAALGVDLHYFSRDIEYHRKQYQENAMPNLRLESRRPTETEKEIETLRTENKELKTRLSEIESKIKETDEQLAGKMLAGVKALLQEMREENVKELGKITGNLYTGEMLKHVLEEMEEKAHGVLKPTHEDKKEAERTESELNRALAAVKKKKGSNA